MMQVRSPKKQKQKQEQKHSWLKRKIQDPIVTFCLFYVLLKCKHLFKMCQFLLYSNWPSDPVICIYVCVCVCIYTPKTYKYIHTYTCIYTYITHIPIYKHTHIYIDITHIHKAWNNYIWYSFFGHHTCSFFLMMKRRFNGNFVISSNRVTSEWSRRAGKTKRGAVNCFMNS